MGNQAVTPPKPGQPFFTVGGAVQASGGLYISRQADRDLLDACRKGAFAYVLTARQMGKSSLMVRAAETLVDEGVRSVIIDLTQIGTQVSSEAWYLGLITVIADQLLLDTVVEDWWQIHSNLGFTQRFSKFCKEVLVSEIEQQIVIFVDEIDTTLSLDFTDDFYVAIRHLYNARSQIPELGRLSFVLIGVATPSDLIRDPKRTPFNIGERIELSDFSHEEAKPLAAGFAAVHEEADATPDAAACEEVLGHVLRWTCGHPYLTQRLCATVAARQALPRHRSDVDQIVKDVFFAPNGIKDNNLQFVRDMLVQRAPDTDEVITLYQQVHRGHPKVRDMEHSIAIAHLKLSGIVRSHSEILQIRNRIYKEVFNGAWIKEHLPRAVIRKQMRRALISAIFWLGIAMIVALVMSVVALWAVDQAQQAEYAHSLALKTADEAQAARRAAEEERTKAEQARDEVQRLLQETQEAIERAHKAERELADINRELRRALVDSRMANKLARQAREYAEKKAEEARRAEAEVRAANEFLARLIDQERERLRELEMRLPMVKKLP